MLHHGTDAALHPGGGPHHQHGAVCLFFSHSLTLPDQRIQLHPGIDQPSAVFLQAPQKPPVGKPQGQLPGGNALGFPAAAEHFSAFFVGMGRSGFIFHIFHKQAPVVPVQLVREIKDGLGFHGIQQMGAQSCDLPEHIFLLLWNDSDHCRST